MIRNIYLLATVGLLFLGWGCTQKVKVPLVTKDTVAVRNKVMQLDSTLAADSSMSGSRHLAIVRLKAQLYHSIGAWKEWGETVLGFANAAYDSDANSQGIHNLLDSVIDLQQLRSTDIGMNLVIANAIFEQYVMYGYKEQAYTKQKMYGEMLLSGVSFPYLDLQSFANQMDYVKLTIGEVYAKLGEYETAKNLQEKYWRLALKGNDEELQTATCYTLCNTLNKMAAFDKALESEQMLLPLTNVTNATKINFYLVMIETLTGKKDTTEAIHYYKKVLQLVEQSQDDTENNYSIAQYYSSYATLLQEQKKFTAAIQNYKNSITNFEMLPYTSEREIAKNEIAICECFIAQNLLDSAFFYNTKAIRTVLKLSKDTIMYDSIIHDLKAENTIMDAFDNRASILRKRYDQTSSIADLKEIILASKISFSVQWLLLSSYDFSESLATENDRGRERSLLAINACYELYQKTKEPYWTLTAFEMAEKSKAIVLQQSLVRQLAFSNISEDTLMVQKKESENKLAALADTIGLSMDKKKDIEYEIKIQTDVLIRTQAALNIKYPNLKTAISKEDSFSLSVIRNRLIDNKTTLVEYFVDSSVSYAFSVAKTGNVSMEKLSKNALGSATKWQYYFTSKNNIANHFQSFCQDAWDVYQQLFPPVTRKIISQSDIEKLIIIADGSLGFTPFDALLTASPSTDIQPAHAPYIINHYTITNGYSAQSLLLRKDHPQATEAAVFAPIFQQHNRGLPPLVYSSEEAATTLQLIDHSVGYMSQQATLQSFTKALPELSLIHLATHASAGDSTEPEIEFYDSSLKLNRIYTLPINANLVVLSACQTGIGRLQTGEGPLSLARGFYYAGARQVITSLWNVDDKSNAAIFKNFYQNNWQHQTSIALREAKMNYLKNAGDANVSPYYWAGMVVFGTDEADAEATSITSWLAAFTTMAVAGLVFYVYKKKKTRLGP